MFTCVLINEDVGFFFKKGVPGIDLPWRRPDKGHRGALLVGSMLLP